jgi:hypothetical protein
MARQRRDRTGKLGRRIGGERGWKTEKGDKKEKEKRGAYRSGRLRGTGREEKEQRHAIGREDRGKGGIEGGKQDGGGGEGGGGKEEKE